MTKSNYPDSEAGARLYLENALHKQRVRFDQDTEIFPDPQVKGVWGVKGFVLNNERVDAVVYLRGYPDPFGKTRENNDFEIGELA